MKKGRKLNNVEVLLERRRAGGARLCSAKLLMYFPSSWSTFETWNYWAYSESSENIVGDWLRNSLFQILLQDAGFWFGFFPPTLTSWKHLTFNGSVQSLSRVRLLATPWTAARHASLSITNSQSLLKLRSIKSVMPSRQLILSPSSCLQSFPALGSFQWVSSSHQVAKVLEFQLHHQSFP